MGKILGPDSKKLRYAVDAVYYTDQLAEVMRRLKPPTLHLLSGVNSDRCCI
jgi:hypothetical protein